MSDALATFLESRNPKKVMREAGMGRVMNDTRRADRLQMKCERLERDLTNARTELSASQIGLDRALRKVKELEEARQFLLKENKRLRGSDLGKVA